VLLDLLLQLEGTLAPNTIVIVGAHFAAYEPQRGMRV
jgi:hypothetical protein